MLALTLVIMIAGFAPSPEDEARRAAALLAEGYDYDALNLWVEIARAHPDDPRSSGWWLDALKAGRGVLDRRSLLSALEQGVAAAARSRAVDLEAREPVVRSIVGTILEQSAYGCSAFHDTDAIDRFMAAYVELFPASPYVGDVLLARAQRILWRDEVDNETARPLFAAAAALDFPNAWIAKRCAVELRVMPACSARVDGGRLIGRPQTSDQVEAGAR